MQRWTVQSRSGSCDQTDEADRLRLTVALMSVLASASRGTAIHLVLMCMCSCDSDLRFGNNVSWPPKFLLTRAPLKPVTWNPVWMRPAYDLEMAAPSSRRAQCSDALWLQMLPGRGDAISMDCRSMFQRLSARAAVCKGVHTPDMGLADASLKHAGVMARQRYGMRSLHCHLATDHLAMLHSGRAAQPAQALPHHC